MRFSSNMFLRVEPSLPIEIAAAARAEGIGRSEFIRRAVLQAIHGGKAAQVERRKSQAEGTNRHRTKRLGASDRDPPPAGPAAQLPVAA